MKRDSTIKILVCDNNPILKQAIERVFLEKGSVELRYSLPPEDFLDAYFLFKPDIAIINVEEDGDNAIDALRYIRNQANDSDTYIIISISNSMKNLTYRVLNEGADDFILKPFSEGGEELISRLNVAKRHVILYKQLLIAYNRLSKEIDTVSVLQQKLLPKRQIDFPKIAIDYFYQPSGRASGDYFDFFPVNKNVLRTVIADVSGHGARAAFVMAMVRALVRASDVVLVSLSEMVSLINNELIDVIGEDMDFVTLFIADIDIKQNRLSYINAGHCPGILVDYNNFIELLGADFSVLGFFSQEFHEKSISLKGKKGLLLYTDGYYEWNLDRENIWGFENFQNLVSNVFKNEELFYLDLLEDYLEKSVEIPPMYRDDRSALWVKFNK